MHALQPALLVQSCTGSCTDARAMQLAPSSAQQVTTLAVCQWRLDYKQASKTRQHDVDSLLFAQQVLVCAACALHASTHLGLNTGVESHVCTNQLQATLKLSSSLEWPYESFLRKPVAMSVKPYQPLPPPCHLHQRGECHPCHPL